MTNPLTLLLLALLFAAALWDLRHREIPNTCVAALLGLGVVGVLSGSMPWTAALLGFGICFAVGLLLFALGAWGGGDAKLVAGVGAVLGSPAVFPALLFSALVGGLLAAIAGLRGERDVAYGPAFAAGTLIAVVTQ